MEKIDIKHAYEQKLQNSVYELFCEEDLLISNFGLLSELFIFKEILFSFFTLNVCQYQLVITNFLIRI